MDEYGGYATSVVGRTIGADFGVFSGVFPLYKAHQPRYDLEWSYYQGGPLNTGQDPLVFIHGTSGTAAAFFYQVGALAEKGYRVISAQFPAYDTPEEWCKGFDLFLDALKVRAAHLFGAGLGGFLVQHYAQRYNNRVKSMVLCNTFATTNVFAEKAGSLTAFVQITPTPLLRKVLLDAFPDCGMELSAKQAIDWIAQQVNDVSGDDLASRLTLNSTASMVDLSGFDQARITIMESSGDTMVPDEVRRHLRGMYPGARLAMLKAGGDFPYVSKPEECTLFIEVHLRNAGVQLQGAEPSAAAPTYAPASTVVAQDEPSGQVWKDEPPLSGYRHTEAPSRGLWKNPFEDDLL